MSAKDNRSVLATTGTNVSDGSWFACDDFEVPFSFYFPTVSATDTFDIRVSNDTTQPADNTHGALFGAVLNTTGPLTKAVTEPYKWIKVRKLAATVSSSVFMLAQLRR